MDAMDDVMDSPSRAPEDFNPSARAFPEDDVSSQARDDPAIDVHQPFTKAERMQQLAEIDQDITSLLQFSCEAVQALVQKPPDEAGASGSDPSAATTANQPDPAAAAPPATAGLPPEKKEQQIQQFQTAADSFFNTLMSVHVRLKRQIYGLEEAGIITLKDGKTAGAATASGAASAGGSAAAAAGAAAGGAGPSGAAAAAGGAGGAAIAGVGPSLEANGIGMIGGLDVGWLNSRSSKVDRDMEAELWSHMRQHLETVRNLSQEEKGEEDAMMGDA